MISFFINLCSMAFAFVLGFSVPSVVFKYLCSCSDT